MNDSDDLDTDDAGDKQAIIPIARGVLNPEVLLRQISSTAYDTLDYLGQDSCRWEEMLVHATIAQKKSVRRKLATEAVELLTSLENRLGVAEDPIHDRIARAFHMDSGAEKDSPESMLRKSCEKVHMLLQAESIGQEINWKRPTDKDREFPMRLFDPNDHSVFHIYDEIAVLKSLLEDLNRNAPLTKAISFIKVINESIQSLHPRGGGGGRRGGPA